MHSFGGNNDGQLGDGTTDSRLSPMEIVSAGTDSVFVTSNGQDTYLLKENGAIYAFGSNSNGQIGDG
eukprot:COSAG02_NODE_38317_length_430_cov_1.241692_1_plen_66_part_10